MIIWDKIANIQKLFWNKNGEANAAPVFSRYGYVKHGVALDIAKNLPKNSASFQSAAQSGKEILSSTEPTPLFNDYVETARQKGISGLSAAATNPVAAIGGGAALGTIVPGLGTGVGAVAGGSIYGVGALDRATDGKLGNALMSGTKGVRSNYAFLKEATNANASLGLLAGLSQIGGAIAGAAGTIAAGAAVGSVAPGVGTVIGGLAGFGAVLGFYGGGKIARTASESGILGEQAQQAATFAQSVEGQEKYNFGRDVTKAAGRINGLKTLQNTDTGIGAVTSGIVNFFAEVPLTPDIKAVQFAGKATRAATVGGISTAKQGMIGGKLQEIIDTPAKKKARLEADVDLLKRTAAGEKTSYTPMFDFISQSDPATVKMRTEFAVGDEISHVAAQLMAGKSPSEISLILRIGRGDATAIDELALKHKATYAQLLRAESKLVTHEKTSNLAFQSGNKLLKKAAKDKGKILQGELEEMGIKNAELGKKLALDSALQERTVSIVPFIEKARNDVARQKIANKLGINKVDLTARETFLGKVTQKVYQDNAFGAVVRLVERWTDDAPHSTVNFNDPLQSTGRVRTTIREGVQRGIFSTDEVVDLYNNFIKAPFEADKLKYVDDFTKTVFERIAIKYGIPESSRDMVLNEYLYRMKKNKEKAKESASQNRAYMKDGDEIIVDPWLVSQLANGSYLPDIALIDDAFKQFKKMTNSDFGGVISAGVTAKWLLDEYNSIWRNFTLARTGYPINITRDNTLRIAADGQWFNTVKYLGKETLEDFTNSNNSVSKIKRWTKSVTDKNYSLKETRSELKRRIELLADSEAGLKEAGYNFNKPPKKIKPEVQRALDWYNLTKRNVELLQMREQELIGKIQPKTVGRKPVAISEYAFQSYNDGVYGRIAMNKIRGKDDIRGLLESNRELQLAEVRRDRTGGTWIQPTLKNEDLHLKSWETILVNTLPSDPVAVAIMKGTKKKDIIKSIKTGKIGQSSYIDRFGYDSSKKRPLRRGDAEYIYDRVLKTVNQFAPDIKLQKLVVENKVSAVELKKMYPDVLTRPGVNSDMAIDMLGQSNFIKKMNKYTRDVVTWLATVPPSKLAYNPYYRNAYEQKLQSMVAVANAQGRKLSDMNQATFEANAHAYALKELKSKINTFSRDMNYPALANQVLAFFPAVVEQYRAYGRIAVENPEFYLKTFQMREIPNRLGEVQVDANGDEYIKVGLPMLGDNVDARLPTSWFNPYNPTGGNIISTSPVATAITNEILKNSSIELPKQLEEYILPFGVQANTLNTLTPTTLRRLGQAIVAFTDDNANQLNKDVAMIMENKLFEFKQSKGRYPNPDELTKIEQETKRDGQIMAITRFMGAGFLPLQPRYVSPLQVYADLLKKYNDEFGGADGTQKFLEDYPEYFLVADKLTDSLSGIYPDKTSEMLVKRNPAIIERMVARMGTDSDLRVLGAVFNDEDYAFSSSAQAYLQTHGIPGTKKMFFDQQSALENARSSIVKEGWRQWTLLIDTVSRAVEQNDPPYDPSKGYGKAILDSYKQAFVEKMKTDNNAWYLEKQDRDTTSKLNNVVDALTIAANDNNMWADLSKQPRWHTIVEYLNFRYYIKDKLDTRSAPITSDRAWDIREEVDSFVNNLRKSDVNFGKFYDRYFDNDNFTYVNED